MSFLERKESDVFFKCLEQISMDKDNLINSLCKDLYNLQPEKLPHLSQCVNVSLFFTSLA
jgi:hypothetical protein